MAGFTGLDCVAVAVVKPSSFHNLLQPDRASTNKKGRTGRPFFLPRPFLICDPEAMPILQSRAMACQPRGPPLRLQNDWRPRRRTFPATREPARLLPPW